MSRTTDDVKRALSPGDPNEQAFFYNALISRVGSGPRQATKPCQQRSQMGAIFLSNPSEFQPHSASALRMAHNSLGSDLPLFYEKINLCLDSNRLRFMCLNKDSSKAQISNA
jgi:hypothetical protein